MTSSPSAFRRSSKTQPSVFSIQDTQEDIRRGLEPRLALTKTFADAVRPSVQLCVITKRLSMWCRWASNRERETITSLHHIWTREEILSCPWEWKQNGPSDGWKAALQMLTEMFHRPRAHTHTHTHTHTHSHTRPKILQLTLIQLGTLACCSDVTHAAPKETIFRGCRWCHGCFHFCSLGFGLF